MREIINVSLYGGKGLFGGKESPLEASIIYCDKYNECSYYKNNQCWNVRNFKGHCKYGNTQTVTGYTSRAMKYYDFKKQYTDHESYNKLKSPPDKLGIIGDSVILPYPHIYIKNDDGHIKLDNPGFCGGIAFVDKDKFTTELIHRICKFRPSAVMGGEIKDYQIKIVPLFLSHLRDVMPETYKNFVNEYKDYVVNDNYVGRKAFLKTINPSVVRYESRQYPQFNENWEWDGVTLTFKSGYAHSFNVVKDYSIEKLIIKPTDKTTITISDNGQVNEQTIFID